MASDTSYLNLSQTSQVKDIVLHKSTLTSDTSYKFGDSEVTLNSDQLISNLGLLLSPKSQ